ncbi:MAG TPA: ATP citrate lyase citrate-binding domain-containing protein [Anaerolineae bacterium]|nr:ATP citrate lyase citrate-binding domain-containing protein [Anaerolineae bacterium]HQH38224.1 ATP citrate lyase citrate-binding domain-containing protein [Anaerolineae bacterium]
MARRAIREYDAKRLLARYLPDYLPGFSYPGKIVLVEVDTDWDRLAAEHPWLLTDRLVVKPDQLFGKRGKYGLLGIDLDFAGAKAWIAERMHKEVTIGKTTDKLSVFIIEPFVPHDPRDEMFIAIRTEREQDVIYFSLQGGIDIEENWASVVQIAVPVLGSIEDVDVAGQLPDFEGKAAVVAFITALYKFFVDLAFTYLEINPFALVHNTIIPLDFVGQVDDTAAFEAGRKWGELPFPPAFGMHSTLEEAYIRSLDEKGGSSLKLTVLNPQGRIWPMIAGGGASVIYADTVTDLGFAGELACYGEYSGNPTTDETREYARTLLDLMTRRPDPQGRPKYLLIGGGIANFTDVAKTFTGIVDALREYKERLRENNVHIYVRRGGPNYQEGLALMRKLGEELGVPIEVYGPETHMTRIVTMALTQDGHQEEVR